MAFEIIKLTYLLTYLSQTYSWTKKSPLNFGSNPDPESGPRVRIRIWTQDPDHIFLVGCMQSDLLLLIIEMFTKDRNNNNNSNVNNTNNK